MARIQWHEEEENIVAAQYARCLAKNPMGTFKELIHCAQSSLPHGLKRQIGSVAAIPWLPGKVTFYLSGLLHAAEELENSKKAVEALRASMEALRQNPATELTPTELVGLAFTRMEEKFKTLVHQSRGTNVPVVPSVTTVLMKPTRKIRIAIVGTLGTQFWTLQRKVAELDPDIVLQAESRKTIVNTSAYDGVVVTRFGRDTDFAKFARVYARVRCCDTGGHDTWAMAVLETADDAREDRPAHVPRYRADP